MTPFAMAAGALFFCGAAMSGAMPGEVSGREVFAPCRACHSLDKNAGVMPGPSLSGLIGRAVGGDPEFQYSPVLRDAKDAGLIWTEQRLEEFLADPEGMFPGMWMSYPGIRDESERAALTRYIVTSGDQALYSVQQKEE
jgi:cytochrome c